ncbi:glutamate-5-semialdehyde dehydrogenase [Candidatus Methylopumilus planktonicus]|uniref:glutamate-5-semialdehyde dehydrogenase n=1 Tax=Candidatus Methylopumilus planktonicus TaxID=1581557 RepID=UPI00111F0412|nr:glutamate-5-semialdehyde dehydrogenase [Candidatus Methylopumilus planktonicus]QDD10571.1 glutamate-5-semialdehyde dehydrogenase [Candidatus Methylopumilus planktonicus]QDD23040.1 glutamate-5-semialdehyde dehydrogenase [Candidatus Methylopumilus planktonicus]
MTNTNQYLKNIGLEAKKASLLMAKVSTQQKNDALTFLIELLNSKAATILKANEKDVQAAKKNKLDRASIDRLIISSKTIDSMIKGIQDIVDLRDPIGEIMHLNARPSGIQVGQMRVALGVIGMIYESRPNVTIDAASLSIKSGNAIILRGGSESIHSNIALSGLIHEALKKSGLSIQAVQVIDSTDRSIVKGMIKLNDYIDVIIPRGGKSLTKMISDEATVPVIKHLDGNCHVYVDKDADLNKTLKIIENSKTQRLGTCNTTESLLISKHIARDFLPKIVKMLHQHKVEVRGCKETLKLVKGIKKASEDDFYTEYLDAIISCKIVIDIDEAIHHINQYSSHHTDAIVTENYERAMQFLKEVDSSSVMVNASTRFADGFEYGLGAEIGISTNKLHVRGPVGLEGLTSLKYIVLGNGHTRK